MRVGHWTSQAQFTASAVPQESRFGSKFFPETSVTYRPCWKLSVTNAYGLKNRHIFCHSDGTQSLRWFRQTDIVANTLLPSGLHFQMLTSVWLVSFLPTDTPSVAIDWCHWLLNETLALLLSWPWTIKISKHERRLSRTISEAIKRPFGSLFTTFTSFIWSVIAQAEKLAL